MHLPSSPSSSEEAGTVSLLLDSGTLLELETGATLELETSPELDSGISLELEASAMLELDAGKELETGASLELDAGVLPGTASELDAATELDAGASAEEDCSSDDLETCELSLERMSVTCVEDESSPQATRAAVKSAHKKTST